MDTSMTLKNPMSESEDSERINICHAWTNKDEDIGMTCSAEFIQICNLGKDRTPLSIDDFIYIQSAILSQMLVFPRLLSVPFSRGAVVVDSTKKVQIIYKFNHIIESSRGRPWVTIENTLAGTFVTNIRNLIPTALVKTSAKNGHVVSELGDNEFLVISTTNESSSDVGSAAEDDVIVTAKNSLAAVAKKKNLSNVEPELENPKTPVTPKEQITGLKTLYVGNLLFAVEQEDVENIFKVAGEVVNIRFGMNSDETFRGFGYVEFASAEAAEKALHELNGKELLRRPVRLDIAKERRSYAPYNGYDCIFYVFCLKGGRGQGQIIFDHGFNKFDEDKMRSLVEHFGSSGETTSVSIL